MPGEWSWKEKGGDAPRMLYAPGNWGDLLKAGWVVGAAWWLRRVFGADAFAYRDPFAGAPDYPLAPRTEARAARIGDALVDAAGAPFLARGRWPSAASLVRSILPDLPSASFAVNDADPERGAAWAARDDVTLLEADDGWAALDAKPPGAGAFLLVDPYDWLAEWRERLPAVLRAAERWTVLLYLYNRSPRGPERLRAYRDFRNALDDAWRGGPRLLGRVGADAFLPRAYHEMLLLPAPAVADAPEAGDLLDTLDAATRRVTGALDRERDVERF